MIRGGPLDAQRLDDIRKSAVDPLHVPRPTSQSPSSSLMRTDDVLDLLDEVADLRKKLQAAEAAVPSPPGPLERTYLPVEAFKLRLVDTAGMHDPAEARRDLLNAYETLHAVVETTPAFYLKAHPEAKLGDVLTACMEAVKACTEVEGPDGMCPCARFIGAQLSGSHLMDVEFQALIKRNGEKIDATWEKINAMSEVVKSSDSYVPQTNAAEMMMRLGELGFGKQEPRRGNTLWAMVMDAADEIAKQRPTPDTVPCEGCGGTGNVSAEERRLVRAVEYSIDTEAYTTAAVELTTLREKFPDSADATRLATLLEFIQ